MLSREYDKKHPIKNNELRVVKLNRDAIEQILWEALLDRGEYILDLPNSDGIIFHMTVDETMSELTFYACDYSNIDRPPDFERYDTFIKENVEKTTDSIYYALPDGKNYYKALFFDN